MQWSPSRWRPRSGTQGVVDSVYVCLAEFRLCYRPPIHTRDGGGKEGGREGEGELVDLCKPSFVSQHTLHTHTHTHTHTLLWETCSKRTLIISIKYGTRDQRPCLVDTPFSVVDQKITRLKHSSHSDTRHDYSNAFFYMRRVRHLVSPITDRLIIWPAPGLILS